MPIFHFFNKTVTVHRPSSNIRRIVYWNGGEDSASVLSMLNLPHTAVAVIDGLDWNRELSPWTVERVFKKGDDFAGGAEAYLLELANGIVPAVETELGCAAVSRAVAGYSLAGLFAVWALYQTDAFDRAASMSGSLWFDGFTEFMEEKRPVKVPEKVYLSVGEREKFTKNARMAEVEACTVRAAEVFRGYGTEVLCEMNSGGHFDDVPERIVRGIQWIGEI